MKKLDKLEVVKAKIVEQTGKTMEEVNELIADKKEELEFLINDYAASHIIAKDLKVDLNKPLIGLDRLDQIVDRIQDVCLNASRTGQVFWPYKQVKQIIREGMFKDTDTISLLKFETPEERIQKFSDEVEATRKM